jgi:hypothetical protein
VPIQTKILRKKTNHPALPQGWNGLRNIADNLSFNFVLLYDLSA